MATEIAVLKTFLEQSTGVIDAKFKEILAELEVEGAAKSQPRTRARELVCATADIV